MFSKKIVMNRLKTHGNYIGGFNMHASSQNSYNVAVTAIIPYLGWKAEEVEQTNLGYIIYSVIKVPSGYLT